MCLLGACLKLQSCATCGPAGRGIVISLSLAVGNKYAAPHHGLAGPAGASALGKIECWWPKEGGSLP